MQLLILCLKIFIVRILDVSLGTIYTIVVVRGKKLVSAIIGFIEIFIWFMIVREALNFVANSFIESLIIGISYALGFSVGTIVGGLLTEKYIHGLITLQIVTTKYDILIPFFRNNGYAVTVINIEGINDDVKQKMLIMEISDIKLEEVKKSLKELDEKSFLIVTDTRFVKNGYGFLK